MQLNALKTLPSPKTLLAFAAILLLAFLIRLPLLNQSLWYDEMYSLINYILHPWPDIFTGTYSPNNHIFFTALAKLFSLGAETVDDFTQTIRLPSLLAGSLAPIALAWPLARQKPWHALLIALIASLHPWLLSFSGWARGYALEILLVILATNFLPTRKQFISATYALLLTAALYTQPLAALLVPGHALATFRLRRDAFTTWLRSLLLASLITFALYSPFFTHAREYFTRKQTPSIHYADFVNQSFRFAQAGDNLSGLPALAVPILILLAGSFLAYSTNLARPQIITFACASLIGLLLPFAVPNIGEVRAMFWLIPLYCLSVTAILISPSPGTPGEGRGEGLLHCRSPVLKFSRYAATAILVAFLTLRCYSIQFTPAQPIRDAVQLATQLAGDDQTPIVGLYMASIESRALYGQPQFTAYRLNPDPTGELPSLKDLEPKLAAYPKPPLVIVFYEEFLKRDEPTLWQYLHEHYTPIRTLPGRISPATIYKSRVRTADRSIQ